MDDKKYSSMDVKDYRIEEEDRKALAGLSPVPQPPRKVQSYSQQLRGPSGSKTHHQKTRQRSLEEIPKPTCASGAPISSNQCYDSDDEFFHQTSSNAAATSPSNSVIYPLHIPSSTSDKDSTTFEDDALLRHCQPLPEFLASGGTGVFKAPNRCAVHPGRPACLELRPHPLRETQVGKFLRNIACTDTQLWAGLECGVRYWSFENAYEPGCGLGGKVRRGDEDAAPFHESSNTTPTMCLLIDDATGLVWTGHKDGKIRSWKMDQTCRDDDDADTTTTDPPPPATGNRNSSKLNSSSRDVFNNNTNNNNINNSISNSSDISNNYNSSSSNYNYNENKEKDGGGNDAHSIKDGLTWQAHKNPVLSLVMSSQGDLWSGSEGGVIKIWPWDTIEKSLLFKSGEKRMASLLVERSQIDLRAQVTVNGACRISSSDIKCLLSDNVRAKVWCAQSVFFSLWDARTKDLLKVFNIDGQIENRVDMLSAQEKGQGQGQGQDQPAEDEMKVKFVSSSSSKKEKSQGFLQRSRNAIMGAADAVRRVATRGAGAFAEDNKRTEAIVLTADGMVWSGCSNGLLVQWDGNGNRLQDFTYHSCAVQCFCTFGSRLYVGYVSGIIQVLDLEGSLIAVWVAHSNPVLKLAVGNGHVYSLATHGGIRGWNISSPGPLDSILRAELAGRELAYTRKDSIRILIGTWNVGQGRASPDALMSWLGSTVSDVGIVVVGLQEVDMGAGFLAMSAAKETVGLEGSSVGHWWMDAIGKAIGEGLTFERMGSRQLAGLLISLWVRKNLRTHVGDVDAAAVPCGFGRAIGNKGGVGLRIRVHDRIMCFVNCHLAAHLEAVNRRNADFDHIFRNMAFSRTSNLTAAAGVTTAAQTLKNTNAVGANSEEPKPDLSEADMVVFTGDFNYRLFGISYDEARDFVSQRTFDWLREKDQLRAEMKAGKVFQGMREALITFPPTYKFERGQPGLGGYDSGEKKRIPAWCDRVIYRDSRTSSVSECGLECPMTSSVIQYEACMDVNESDHKPVRCKFHVQISHVDRSVRRQEFGEIIKCNEKVRSSLEELRYIPETTVSTTHIVLQNQDTSVLRITNKCVKEKAIFKIICEGQSTIKDDGEVADYRARGCYGYPRWLEVMPAAGIIKPDNFVDISVHHEEHHTLEEYVDGVPDTWWCEDTRDKEVILVVVVQGSSSTDKQTHRINVRHCFSAKAVRIDSRSNSSKKGKRAGSSVHRSET